MMIIDGTQMRFLEKEYPNKVVNNMTIAAIIDMAIQQLREEHADLIEQENLTNAECVEIIWSGEINTAAVTVCVYGDEEYMTEGEYSYSQCCDPGQIMTE